MKLRNIAYVIIIGLVGGFALIASTGGTKRAVKKRVIIENTEHKNTFTLKEKLMVSGDYEIWIGEGSGQVSTPNGVLHVMAEWQGTVWMLPAVQEPRLDPLATDSIHGEWEDTALDAHGKFWGYIRADGVDSIGFWWTDNIHPQEQGTWDGKFNYLPNKMAGTWHRTTGGGDGSLKGHR